MPSVVPGVHECTEVNRGCPGSPAYWSPEPGGSSATARNAPSGSPKSSILISADPPSGSAGNARSCTVTSAVPILVRATRICDRSATGQKNAPSWESVSALYP